MTDQSPTGKRIPANEFSQLLRQHDQARLQATHLIEDAQQKAHRLVEDAESKVAQHQDSMRDLSTRQLRQFIDEDSLRRHAQGFVSILSEVRKIRREHNEMIPWVEELVSTAMRKIIADFDAIELVARMVAQAVLELQQLQNVRLTVHPSCLHMARAAKEDYPEFMLAISQISPNPNLKVDEYQLSCTIGSAKISVSAYEKEVLKVFRQSNTVQVED